MNSDIPFVSEIALALNWLMYSVPSYKNISVLSQHCSGSELVSAGSGFGMLEKMLENNGIKVTTIEQEPHEWKSVCCSHKMSMQNFIFRYPCVLFFGFPGKSDHDGVISPSGLCNYLQTLLNCIQNGCLVKIIVTCDESVKDYLLGTTESDENAYINVGTKQLWDYLKDFFTRGKHGPASSFFMEKYMTEFTLTPHNALKMLEQAVKDGYIVSHSCVSDIASSVLDQKQQSLIDKQKTLMSKRTMETVLKQRAQRYEDNYFVELPLSDLFDKEMSKFGDDFFPEFWSEFGKSYVEYMKINQKRIKKLNLEIKILEKDLMLFQKKISRECADILKKYF